MGINSCGTTLIDNGTFQGIGSVTWDTTAKTSGFTGVAGNGYFVNTTGGAITVTLPSSPSAGDVVGIKDYANTADTNIITIGRNGSNINGDAEDYAMNIEGLSVLLVYVDGTKGWLVTNSAQASDLQSTQHIIATGGTITTCGDFKIHTFTGPGTFCVSNVGTPAGSDKVDYLVVAGGGSGGNGGPITNAAGGGGGGGYRTSFPTCGGSLPVSATAYPITVGGGGSAPRTSGSNSIFSTITSAGGGGGGKCGAPTSGLPGGSGGGGRNQPVGNVAGNGNTPPVSPPQGNNGGQGANIPPGASGGGGGGATTVGGNGSPSQSGNGGTGATNSISSSPISYSGGGGGKVENAIPGTQGTSPCGSGGDGGTGTGVGTAGQTNRGGGGGGGSNGGSGIVIIRYKYK
jgi:hypothetical protein